MDIIGSQSDAIYIGKGSSALSVVGTAQCDPFNWLYWCI